MIRETRTCSECNTEQIFEMFNSTNNKLIITRFICKCMCHVQLTINPDYIAPSNKQKQIYDRHHFRDKYSRHLSR